MDAADAPEPRPTVVTRSDQAAGQNDIEGHCWDPNCPLAPGHDGPHAIKENQ